MSILSVGENVEELEVSCTSGESKNDNITLEKYWAEFYKINIFLLYYSTISLLSIYPIEIKAYAYAKACSLTFIATLFITVKLVAIQMPKYGEWTTNHSRFAHWTII